MSHEIYILGKLNEIKEQLDRIEKKLPPTYTGSPAQRVFDKQGLVPKMPVKETKK